MTPEQLGDEIEKTIRAARYRVEVVGAKDYYVATDTQKFESMSAPELFDYALEELEDIVAYAVMLRININRLREEFIRHGF